MRELQKQNLLPKIGDNQLDPSAVNLDSGSITLGGVLTIAYTVDLSVPQVTFTVSISGTQIGGGTLNVTNPSVTVSGSYDGVKASLTLTANFSSDTVTYTLSLCVPIFGCTSYTGTLYSWS